MIIGNYTADVSVGETAPSPTSPEPLCRKDTIRGGRVLDGGDACHVSAGESPAGVGVGSIELSRDEADTVDMLRSSLGGESSRDDAARSNDLGSSCRRLQLGSLALWLFRSSRARGFAVLAVSSDAQTSQNV